MRPATTDTSGRLPDRGVDRPPYPAEVQHARRYTNRLRHAITQGARQIDKRIPRGRFDDRAYARGRAERAAGRPVSSHPWRPPPLPGLIRKRDVDFVRRYLPDRWEAGVPRHSGDVGRDRRDSDLKHACRRGRERHVSR
jgi:hypothetical protein